MKSLLQGLGLGAGLMYFLDPDRGRRRRALVLDQFDHATHCAEDFLGKTQRDMGNRAAGLAAQAGAAFRHDGADDRVVTERVRSKLGRYVSHPHAVHVGSRGGYVTLSGQVMVDEFEDLIKAVQRVRGVQSVEDQLEVHRKRGRISALQGGGTRPGEHYDFMQQNWSPATRALAQLTGVALAANWIIRRDLPSAIFGTLGLGLFLRGATNRSLGQMTGAQVCPQASSFQRTVTIQAPVEKVWDFITDFEQVGRFLPSVTHVQKLGEGRYRWAIRLPAGQDLELEERVTESVPYERLSWESVANRPVSYTGTVGLQREGDNTTRVNVHFEYTPPGGALADAAGSLFGLNAESRFQDAVVRIKSFLETGNLPHDVHEVNPSRQTSQSS